MDSNNGSTPNGEDGAGTVIKKEDTQDENMTIKPDPEIAPEISDLSIEAVLAFLKKKGLSGTEDKLKQELSNPSTNQNSQNPEQGNSQDATASSVQSGIVKTEGSSADVSNVLDSYKSEGDPSIYADAYKDLQRFVEASLDLYRHELALILVSQLFYCINHCFKKKRLNYFPQLAFRNYFEPLLIFCFSTQFLCICT